MKLFYSMSEVCEMFGVSRTTIGRWEDEAGFPPRVYLGVVRPSSDTLGRRKRSNCRIGFPCSEVDAWAKTRMDNRARLSKEGLRLVTTS
jgi:predicted DNA-binding transcriptional regulator AlpA